HKIALQAIAAGAEVTKYGSPIGTASREIAAGAHVHTHNRASSLGRGDLASGPAADPPAARPAQPRCIDPGTTGPASTASGDVPAASERRTTLSSDARSPS